MKKVSVDNIQFLFYFLISKQQQNDNSRLNDTMLNEAQQWNIETGIVYHSLQYFIGSGHDIRCEPQNMRKCLS